MGGGEGEGESFAWDEIRTILKNLAMFLGFQPAVSDSKPRISFQLLYFDLLGTTLFQTYVSF